MSGSITRKTIGILIQKWVVLLLEKPLIFLSKNKCKSMTTTSVQFHHELVRNYMDENEHYIWRNKLKEYLDIAFIVLYFTCSHSMHDCLLKFYFIAFVTMVALSTNVLGYDTTLDQPSWCWINPSVTNALFWQFFTGKFWEIISYIATVVLYSIVKCFIWKKVVSLILVSIYF